jgi:hypothetical protein
MMKWHKQNMQMAVVTEWTDEKEIVLFEEIEQHVHLYYLFEDGSYDTVQLVDRDYFYKELMAIIITPNQQH